MKLKITQQTKSLCQSSTRRIQLTDTPNIDATNQCAKLVQYLAEISTQIKDYTAYEDLGNIIASFAFVDSNCGNDDIFDVHTLRDFDINDDIHNQMNQLITNFLGDWKVVSGNFSGHTFTVEELSAPSQMILSVLVQTLGYITAQTPSKAEVLVELVKKNAHLKDKSVITGSIFTVGKMLPEETRAKLIITRYAIDLKDMNVVYNGSFQCCVALESQLSLDELISANRCQTRSRNVPQIDEMER